MARAFDKQGLSAAGDSAQQQRHQVAPDAELVIDDSLCQPKGLGIDDESFSARRLQLIKSAERRMAPRFLLGIFLTIFVNYIDRTNLAFASVQMNKDLGLSPSVYGLGAGLFFISYALLQLPSNAALDVFGGPKWMAFICLTWGAVAAGFAGIRNEAGFLALRFLLGMFEAGAFPGCVYYVSLFYPRDRTQVPMSVIVLAILISQCAGAGLAAGFLSMDGLGSLRGWQWLFLIEGLLCVLVSAYWWILMPRDIKSMTFLQPEERAALQAAMDEQALGERQHGGGSLLAHYWSKVVAALRNPVTLTASAWGFFYLWSYYGIIYWAPMFVNLVLGRGASTSTKADVTTIGLTAIPYGVAAIWQVLFSWHSQYRAEKKWHIAGSWAAAGLTMLLLPVSLKSGGAAGFAVFILCTMFVYGAYSLNQSYIVGLMGAERGMGGAIVNSLANFGGFVGPYVLGALYQSTGSHIAGMYLMGAGLFVTVTILSIYQPKWSLPKPNAVAEQGKASV